MPKDPAASSATAAKNALQLLQTQLASISDFQKTTTTAIDHLTAQLESTRSDLAATQLDLENMGIYASALEVELDVQYGHIARLSTGRRADNRNDDEDFGDDEAEEAENEDGLSVAAKRQKDAAKNKDAKVCHLRRVLGARG